jgi:membrane protein implicated in regulation of membrane protease activity
MIALILAHPHIFWLSLGGLLLAAEMLGGNGYLLERHCRRRNRAAGLDAAVELGVAGYAVAVLTLLAAWLWSRWLRNRVKRQKPADAQLNQRGQQLLGRRFTLETALVNGRGHVRVGDSSWPVIADDDQRRAARLKWSPSKASPYI